MIDDENDLDVGDRVYVRELDVFGEVIGMDDFYEYIVKCEPPMPGYIWMGPVNKLSLAPL